MKTITVKYCSVLVLMLVMVFSAGMIEASAYDGEWNGSGTFKDYSDEASWPVTLDSAGTLTVDVETDMDLRFALSRVENNEKKHIDGETVEKGSESMDFDLAAGEYTLDFYYYNGMGSFSYKAHFDSANETYTGDNNTVNEIRNSAAIPFGKAINGFIAQNDQDDYYKLVLETSGRLTMDVHNEIDEQLYLTLYDGEENYLLNDYMEEGDNSYAADLAAGTYYFRAQQHWSDTGKYRFTAGFTPSGETYTAENNTVNAVRDSASIPLAKEVVGHLAYNDECDYYKIVVPAGARYAVRVNASMEQLEFCMLDSKENYVADTTNNTTHYHKKGTATYTYKLKSGTYYLYFDKNGSDLEYMGEYSFRVKVSVPKPAIKSLSKGRKKYYVRMRAYKTIKGKKYCYSSWCKVKTGRTR